MPLRTCIACKRRTEQQQLLRVGRDSEGNVALWSGIGRSAYICKIESCVEAAFAKGRLERALRSALTPVGRVTLKLELECKLR